MNIHWPMPEIRVQKMYSTEQSSVFCPIFSTLKGLSIKLIFRKLGYSKYLLLYNSLHKIKWLSPNGLHTHSTLFSNLIPTPEFTFQFLWKIPKLTFAMYTSTHHVYFQSYTHNVQIKMCLRISSLFNTHQRFNGTKYNKDYHGVYICLWKMYE